ncbi:MAG: MliC family protein [Hyphomonadaceae bacterium]|nr:MliC family protein [Hyphomonadaceae bacterium]MBX3510083.1 MliC family protein [Hyphomonadaceae bacterium]
MKKLLALASLAVLASCASTPGGPRADWRCEGGAAFSVRFSGQQAEVFAGGQVYTLAQQASGSGIRYANGAVEYREHQGEATLSGAHGGPYNNCRR